MADTVFVDVLPPCDLCRGATAARAAYDARMARSGAWAFLCESHYQLEGMGRLGTGYGQRLVVRT